MCYTKYAVLIVIGVTWMKLVDVLKQKEKTSQECSLALVAQTLRNMLGNWIDNSRVIDKGSFRIRKNVWHTSALKHADNNSKPLSNQYSIIFDVNLIYTFFFFIVVPFIILVSTNFVQTLDSFLFYFYSSRAVAVNGCSRHREL